MSIPQQPFPENEQQRLQALQNYEILNSLSEAEFDRLTELASVICDTPISLVSLIDENRQWFKSKVGLEISETPRGIAFCQHTIMQDELFEVQDATADDRFKDNVLVTEKPDIRFYAGFPLKDPDGFNLGTICVIDRKPRSLTPAQRRALALLSEEVTGLIVERRQKEELRNFENLFQHSPDLICIAGFDGFFKKVNPAFTQLLRRPATELMTTPFASLIHAEDQAATSVELARLEAGETTLNFIMRMRDAENTYHSIQWTASPEPGSANFYAVGRDITRELAKEEQLAASEARSRAFFENSQGLMCTHNVAGKLLSVNMAGAAMLGYTTAELTGKTLYDIIPVDHHPGLKRYLAEIRTAGSAMGQMTIFKKNGMPSTWLFNNVLELAPDGELYVIGNATDITERYQLEKRLLQTTEMLEETNQVARIGGWQVDLVHEKIYWTSVTKQIHGVSEDFEPDLQTGINFYKAGESREAIIAAVAHTRQDGSSWDLELQIVNTSGQDVWVRAVGTGVMSEGVCVRMYGTFQDIDEKKKAQLEIDKSRAVLAAFVEHAPAAVAMVDRAMNYVAVSNCWLEDHDLKDQQVIGVNYYQISPNITAAGKARHQRILAGHVERCAEDAYQLTPDGEILYMAWEMRPWYQLNGEIGGMMVFTQDVTFEVKQREELKAAKMQAEEASVAKSEFLANMSHEIRTPLNGVIGFTDLVLKTNLTDTQQQYLTIVNQSGNALLSIINDILDFSKIEAGKLELEIEKSDLYELSAQATDIITYQVQHKGLEMLLNLTPGLPRFIWADAVRLKQVIINLLSNAAKFTEKGEIELRIESLSKTGEQSNIRFSVRDTGIGIKPEKQGKIFEAFSQEDGSTTKKYGGTGLGLTISNKLLAMMGSKLELESVPGQGSTFFFDLNLQTADGDALKWDNLERVKQVMVVDDNDNNREIINQMLLLKNIRTTPAKNGFEALQLLAAGHRYDVILMDYHMPYMNGLETISKIRETFYATQEEQPIILLSSSSDDEKVASSSERLQVNHRLLKPVKIQDIYGVLSRLYQTGNHRGKPDSRQAAKAQDVNAYTILIAEDNAVNMLLAVTILKRLLPNVQLIEVTDGLAAVSSCQLQLPDLIFMDVQMPVMNGYEATRQIRLMESGTHIPIIALTAGNVKSERDACFEAGMDDFAVKPVIEDTIVGLLHKWLDMESTGAGPLAVQQDLNCHYDAGKVKMYAGDDDEMIRQILALTRKELEETLVHLQDQVKVMDQKAIRSTGHKLYGTAVSAGLPLLANLALQLEKMDNFNQQTADALYLDCKKEIAIIMNILPGDR